MAEQWAIRLTDRAGLAPDVPDRFVERGAFGWRWTTDFIDQGGNLANAEPVLVALLDDGTIVMVL